MRASQKRRGPGGNRGHAQAGGLRADRSYHPSRHSARLPDNWRDRLPDPGTYYEQRVAKLGKPNGEGWAQGRCPFHEDRNDSLSVQVRNARGNWKCFAGCGHGDLVSFHERLTGQSFKDVVRDLMGVAR